MSIMSILKLRRPCMWGFFLATMQWPFWGGNEMVELLLLGIAFLADFFLFMARRKEGVEETLSRQFAMHARKGNTKLYSKILSFFRIPSGELVDEVVMGLML